jgi:2-phospho-L-lactate guanylyltransferase
MQITAILPVKGFSTAKARLSPGIDPLDRALIATATAGHVIETCVGAGFRTLVVTDDDAVAALAIDLGSSPVPDPGEGLDVAAAAGIRSAPGPWMVLHGDLPLLDVAILETAADPVRAGRWVAAPSRDGGTNLLGGTGPFEPTYGPGSFHRHLGRIARLGHDAVVLVHEAVAVEIDTPTDLTAAAHRPGGRWLQPFLS